MSETPRIIIETPEQCDGCGANRGHLHQIEQTKKIGVGKVSRVIGYDCDSCLGTFLYRN